MRKLALTVNLLIVLCHLVSAQADTIISHIAQFPNRLFSRLNSKAEKLDDQLTRQSIKYLERMSRQEKRMQQKLAKTDSVRAARIFAGSQEKYAQLEQQLKTPGTGFSTPLQGEYMANIDSTKSALSFLQQNKNLVSGSARIQAEITNANGQFNDLQSKFRQADDVKTFIRQRRQLLQDNLSRLKQNLGVDKFMAQYNQQLYYYSEQVKEYKDMFNDPDKMMKRRLSY